MTDECASLEPKRVRRGKPTWWYCGFSGKEVDPKTKPCTRIGCGDYLERGDETVAGKRINWDGPASALIDGYSGTLREWAVAALEDGLKPKQVAAELGTSADNVYQVTRKMREATSGACAEETQPEPQVMATCWNCDKPFPEDEMQVSGAALYCPDCYRKAREEAQELTCARCGKPRPDDACSLCETCRAADMRPRMMDAGAPTEAILTDADEYICGKCGSVLDNEGPRCPACEPRHYDPADTRKAADAYLRYLGLGEQECFGLGVWLAAWKARGEAAE